MMKKIKAVDIAKELGISKASVSLALNHKPGVSEKKKALIFETKRRLESGEDERYHFGQDSEKSGPEGKGMIIKHVLVNKPRVANWERGADFGSEVLETFTKEVQLAGYSMEISSITTSLEDVRGIIADSEDPRVAGYVLHCAALQPKDVALFKGIRKPTVIYDCDAKGLFNSITINNLQIVTEAMDLLTENGRKDIVYLSHTDTIYNFTERRKYFMEYLLHRTLTKDPEEKIVALGSTVPEIYENFKKYLKEHELPDGFLMENYQVSLGVVKALMDSGVKYPEEVSLVGIDTIPKDSSLMLGNIKLTTYKVPHTERASMITRLLISEIQRDIPVKYKLLAPGKLIEGNTVK